jgi:hypothetical protein
VRGEPSSDQSSGENRSLEPPPSDALGEVGIEPHHPGDPALHAAADVERLLADAPALQRLVDLAAELEPETAAGAGDVAELPGHHASRRAGGTADQR